MADVLGIKINDYMNLRAINGTRILATRDIQRILEMKYNELKKDIQIIYVGDSKYEGYRRVILNIPSESCGTQLYYTTVIDILTEGKAQVQGSMYIKFFSNSPNFMFTYTYVYNKAGLLVEDYKKYLNKKALKEAPKKRNPRQLIGIEKTIAFSILFIREVLRLNINKDVGKEPKRVPPTDMIVDMHAKLRKDKKCKEEKGFSF